KGKFQPGAAPFWRIKTKSSVPVTKCYDIRCHSAHQLPLLTSASRRLRECFWPMILVLSLSISLFLFWLVLSGLYTPFLLMIGAVSAVAIALLARRMEIADREGHPVHLGLSAITYWPWLLK